MRRFTQISLMLAALILCCTPADDLWAKNGRGGMKGGGGKAVKGSTNFRGKGGSSNFGAGPTHRGKKNRAFTEQGDITNHKLNDSDRPWGTHFAKEQRKLDHRKQVADHLRKISDRNGNEHLKQVADDMDQRAQAHYDKQIERITQKYDLEDTATHTPALENSAVKPLRDKRDTLHDSREVVNSTNNSTDEVARKLTGRENALLRQLRNEERKLAKRMEEVERMRAMAEQTGDEGMLQAADRLEQWAMDHFDQRMSQITDFQERHDLPQVSQHLAR